MKKVNSINFSSNGLLIIFIVFCFTVYLITDIFQMDNRTSYAHNNLNYDPPEIVGIYIYEDELFHITLSIKGDGTFEYDSHGDSCWLWDKWEGNWNLENNNIVLYRNYYEKPIESIFQKFEITKNRTIIEIKDDLGNSISNFEVKYSNNDSRSTQKSQYKKTDKKGIVIFNKFEIVNSEKQDAVLLEFNRKGSITNERILFYRYFDKISIIINYQPKIIKTKKYYLNVEKGKLKSSELPYIDSVSIFTIQ